MKTKMLIMDVDGTLTDGRIYIGAKGEVMKAFDVKDGYAIAQILPEKNIIPVIITGRISDIVMERAKELKITELYQGVSDKLKQLQVLKEKYNMSPGEIAYIGDDLNDLDCIKYCGITGCPSDSIGIIKKQVDYVCNSDGGRGAVREFIEWIISKEN